MEKAQFFILDFFFMLSDCLLYWFGVQHNFGRWSLALRHWDPATRHAEITAQTLGAGRLIGEVNEP